MVRLSKLVMVAGLALFALLVAADNAVDYGSNEAFVRHVLAMDTTFPQNALRWRAITDPGLQTAAYQLIIAAEALTGVLFGVAVLVMATRLRAPKARFRAAMPWVAAGAALVFALWFVGFVVVGGEWFLMWQSSTWNGQEAAFRFYLTVLAVSAYVLLDIGEGEAASVVEPGTPADDRRGALGRAASRPGHPAEPDPFDLDAPCPWVL